jgi:hypothetical protein
MIPQTLGESAKLWHSIPSHLYKVLSDEGGRINSLRVLTHGFAFTRLPLPYVNTMSALGKGAFWGAAKFS